MVRLTSEELSPIDMSVLTRFTIRPRLMGVEGVANVSVWGCGTGSCRSWSTPRLNERR